MNRRLILLAALLLALLVPACRPGTPADGRLTLEFWTLSLKPDFTDYIDRLIQKYEALHPNIHLVWLDAPIDVVMPKLLASIAGGVSPDVVNLNSDNAVILAQKGALVNMDEATPEEVRKGYFPGIWNAARYQGSNYAIPWYVSTQVMIYNADIFRHAGLDPDRPPRTWDEVVAAARQIRRRTPYYGFMPFIKFVDDLQLFGIPVLSPDGKRAVFNSPEGVARLQWYVDLFKQDIVPMETLTRGYAGAVDRYQSGELGMLFTGPQFLTRVHEDAPSVYAVTRVAQVPPSPTGLVSASTMNFAVPRASRHRKEAVELAEFLTNDENQLEFCKRVPILPSRIKAADDPFFTRRKIVSIEDQAIMMCHAELSTAKDLSLGLPHSEDLGRAINEALEGALYGHKTAKQALDDAAAAWDQILSPGVSP